MLYKGNTMKKQIIACAAALIAFAMTGCEQKGTIQGEVCDAFTGKALEMPTIWMDSTIYSTLKKKYPYKQELRKGQFKFENVPFGTYKVLANRAKYIKSHTKVTVTESSPVADVKLYIYSDQVDPGLYEVVSGTPSKIKNDWSLWAVRCGEESIAGYRLAIPQADKDAAKQLPPEKGKKGKKKKAKKVAAAPANEAAFIDLKDPKEVSEKFNVFYRNASSVSSDLVVKSYAVANGPVAAHKDCAGFDAGEANGIFAIKSKVTDLKSSYVAENLYRIEGTLPKGKQIVQLSQDGKVLQTYYVEVK